MNMSKLPTVESMAKLLAAESRLAYPPFCNRARVDACLARMKSDYGAIRVELRGDTVYVHRRFRKPLAFSLRYLDGMWAEVERAGRLRGGLEHVDTRGLWDIAEIHP